MDGSGFDKEEDSDSLFFRFGFYDYMRLNLHDMVMKYEEEVWYQLDFLFDWEQRKVALFVDGTWSNTQKFFYQDAEIESANAIILYNLAPDTRCNIKAL